jgi:hypothetical protein
MSRAWLCVALIACSSKDDPPQVAPTPPRDAGVPMDGITAIGRFDPASGMHLDDDMPNPVRPRQARQPGKLVDITLRSSPPGAIAAVDGQQIGRTPTYAPVTSGIEHEFTFVLEGYAVARYRFVPIQSGVVHATMEPVSSEIDAGVALPPEMSRPQPTLPPPAVPAPPTLVSPPDAAISIDATTPSGTGPNPF